MSCTPLVAGVPDFNYQISYVHKRVVFIIPKNLKNEKYFYFLFLFFTIHYLFL